MVKNVGFLFSVLSIALALSVSIASQAQTEAAEEVNDTPQPGMPAPARFVVTEDLVNKYLANRRALMVAQRLIITADILNFYKMRNNALIWITNSGEISPLVENLRASLLGLDRHGLDPSEYWTPMIENSLKAFESEPSEVSLIRAELLMTDALLRAARHISYGRIIPEMIDTDIKFQEKKLSVTDNMALIAALAGDPALLGVAIEGLAPQHQFYKLLITALADLKKQEAEQKELRQKSISLTPPNVTLSPGMSHPIVLQIRRALRERGFLVNTEGPIYDSEQTTQGIQFKRTNEKFLAPAFEDGFLQTAIMKFQSENGLEINPVIPPNSDFWKTLSVPISKRIRLVEINLEKLRWLPRVLEQEYIYVNLAFTEFNLYKTDPTTGEDKSELSMKTVNGRLRWHSPFMRHQLTFMTINPTWTSPDSIFAIYEVPEIRKDPKFIENKAFIFLRKPQETEKVDPSLIDWTESPMTIARKYRLRQESGPGNSLGLFRFGLNNDVDVYLHDTNDRQLFQQANRFQSSGCIRLEKPNELAQYLMQASPEYGLKEGEEFETSRLCKETNYPTFFPRPCRNPEPDVAVDPAELTSFVPTPIYEPKMVKFSTGRPLPPVYTVYITVGRVGDKTDGRIRFSQDPYGQDARVEQLVYQNVNQEGF
jgi:murein L,D-transpeptidase YcbB/YkuD